jgi:hypothetical protein
MIHVNRAQLVDAIVLLPGHVVRTGGSSLHGFRWGTAIAGATQSIFGIHVLPDIKLDATMQSDGAKMN